MGLGDRPQVVADVERLRQPLSEHFDIASWDLGFQADLSSVEADLAFVFGGDGSVLRATHQMGYRQVPVVGVNMGTLGFLAALHPNDVLAVLGDLAARRYRVVEHLMFECSLLHYGVEVWTRLGLNEVAIRAGAPFRMLHVNLYVDAEWVTTYSCDGLIISTPVGSTAHSMSAGGPILRKDLQAFVISPIDPHTLTHRPVVDSADRTFELDVPAEQSGAAIVIDGQVVSDLTEGHRLRVRRAAARFQLVEVAGHGYYGTLREKLRWSGSLTRNG